MVGSRAKKSCIMDKPAPYFPDPAHACLQPSITDDYTMITRFKAVFLSLALVALLGGCSMSEDSGIAESEVPGFHQQFNAKQFQAMYAGSANEMKQSIGEKEFVAFLSAIHTKLGPTESTKRQNWLVNYNTSGTFVTLSYLTTYAKGEGTEQFVYRLDGKSAKLVGWNINSNALALN